jgi:3',5'-cyclic AMP phosphodiesterase CpdA
MPERTEAHKVIVQISDTHITAEGALHGAVDTLENLATILAAVEALGTPPDLLLFSGDLADKGEVEAYRRFRTTVEPFAARMAVPALYLPGNHDHRATFRIQLLDAEESDEVADQVVWCGGLRVIALDSTVLGAHHGELDDDQLAWLEDELVEPAPLGTIVALHHPPIPGPSAFLNTLTLRNPERLGKVIAGTDVTLVTAGHAHHASCGALAGVPVWVATASAYQMDVLEATSSALRGTVGSAFTWIDATAEGAVATHVAMPVGPAIYELSFAALEKMLAAKPDAAEIDAIFAGSIEGH